MVVAGGSDVFAGSAYDDPPGMLTGLGLDDTMGGAGGAFATSAAMAAVERHDTWSAAPVELAYNIYSNTGIGDPIDYTTSSRRPGF